MSEASSEWIRPSPHAGTWYPADPAVLDALVEGFLDAAAAKQSELRLKGEVIGLVSPHAGLRYSGPVAGHGFHHLRERSFETVLVLGPSHHLGFEGVRLIARGGFETPFGVISVDQELAESLLSAGELVQADREAHRREHSVEMQLPFLQKVLPSCRFVPMVMGFQRRETIEAVASLLGDRLAATSKRVLLLASSDLSHFHSRGQAMSLDKQVLDGLEEMDPEALQRLFEREPGHACGAGPIVTIMRAAMALGADSGQVLSYADSGDVTFDTSSVVGYASAAFTVSGV